jgi:hypothetical protein
MCLYFYCIQSMCVSSLHSNVYVHLCECVCVYPNLSFEFVSMFEYVFENLECVSSFMVVSFSCVYMCLGRLYSF